MTIIDKIKSTVSSSTEKSSSNHQDEQQFSIQPHPAKTNDPADLQNPNLRNDDPSGKYPEPPQLGGGLNSNPEWSAHHAKGPYQPTSEVLQNIPAPSSREELRARSQALNGDN